MIKILSHLSWLCAGFLCASPSWAASFDCQKSRSPLEILICADQDLSTLDSEVGTLYFHSLSLVQSPSIEAQTLLDAQRHFLNSRLDRCPIPFQESLSESDSSQIIQCLKKLYGVRLGELSRDYRAISEKTAETAASEEAAPSQEAAAEINPQENMPPANKMLPSPATTPYTPHPDNTDVYSEATLIPYLKLAIFGFVIIASLFYLYRLNISYRIAALYKDRRTIGPFSPREQFMNARAKKNVTPLTFIPIALPIAEIHSASLATWSAQKGYVDRIAYNTNLNIYQQHLTQWRIAKTRYDQQQKAINPNAIHRTPYSDSVPMPRKPSEEDFLLYKDAEGQCSAELLHGYVLTSTSVPVTLADGPRNVSLNRLEQKIVQAYRSLFPRMIAGDLEGKIAGATVMESHHDDMLFSRFEESIHKPLFADARKQLGPYSKDLQIEQIKTRFKRKEFLLPLGIVVSKKGKKTIISFHDPVDPSIVIGTMTV